MTSLTSALFGECVLKVLAIDRMSRVQFCANFGVVMAFITILIGVLVHASHVYSTMAGLKELNDGNKIPIVALGTGRGTANGAPNSEVRDAVLWAIQAGYRHVDTAAIYGDEVEVGQGIADAIAKGIVTREELFITTKIWNNKHAEDQVEPAIKESLKRLALDYVDLYLIHFPFATKDDNSFDNIDYLDTWRGMERVKQLGYAKSIGVSNFNVSQIDRLWANAKIKPAVNEIEVNPTLTQESLVSHCQNLGMVVMAYSPFGFLVSRKHEAAPPPRYDDPMLVRIGDKCNKTTGQVVLRYLVQRGVIPIPKSTNKQRIAQNIDLFDFKLTDDEMSLLGSYNKNIRVIDMKAFAEHPDYPFRDTEEKSKL